MQSLSRPSVKCGNSVSKLSSDPIPSDESGPGSKWAASRRSRFCRKRWREGGRKDRGEGEQGGGGDQLTDVVPRVQEPCLFSAGVLEEGPGLGAGREISGSCLQVQIPPTHPPTHPPSPLPTPPPSPPPVHVCVCGGETVAQLP